MSIIRLLTLLYFNGSGIYYIYDGYIQPFLFKVLLTTLVSLAMSKLIREF